MRVMRWFSLGGSMLFLSGCGSHVESTQTTACTPGISVACVGPGGCSGAQVCKDDGTGYGRCDCGGGVDSGGSDTSTLPDTDVDSSVVPDSAPTDSGSDAVTEAGAGAVTYSGSFTSEVSYSAGTSQCDDWNAFRLGINATGKPTDVYSKVTLWGSNDPVGITCTGAQANQICATIQLGGPATILCDGHGWDIKDCSSMGVAVAVDSGSACSCSNPGYILRPCLGDAEWGGIKGATCHAPTQTISIRCE